MLWQWYMDSVDALSDWYVKKSSDGKLKYLPDYPNALFHQQHLACFTPGMLALGVHVNQEWAAANPVKAARDMQLAKVQSET